ncbi:helix-turn-helix domain-containing protein, partial [Nocardioides sp. NPDC000441]
MTSVVEWSPREAEALRAALRLTNEEFAEQLGVSVRAVANWRKGGESAISLQIQRIFDTVLERATDAERERFERLAGLGAAAADGDELRRRLEASTNLHSAVGWLQGGRDDDAAAGVLAAAA